MTSPEGVSLRQKRADLLERYEAAVEWPLLVLSLILIPLILIPAVTDIHAVADLGIQSFLWILWGVFAADLAIRTYLSENRVRYLVRHWYDVLIVVLPPLRPLRIARSARALRLLRVIVAVPFIVRAWTTIHALLRRRALHLVLLTSTILILVGAALVLAFERHGDGTIDDYGTALWWAMTTITTVGYGDTYPTTPEGRGVAIFLMLLGITLFGWITANIAAFLVEYGGVESQGVTTSDLMQKLEKLEEDVAALRSEIAVGARNE